MHVPAQECCHANCDVLHEYIQVKGMYVPAQECCHANCDAFRFPTTPRSGHEELVGIPTKTKCRFRSYNYKILYRSEYKAFYVKCLCVHFVYLSSLYMHKLTMKVDSQ